MRRVAVCAVLGLLAAVAGGCWDSQEKRERRELRVFKAKVEKGCRGVASRLRQRGAPSEPRDLIRLAPPAIVDVRRLVAGVTRSPVPPDAEARVQTLRDVLHDFDHALYGNGSGFVPYTSVEDALESVRLIVASAAKVESTAHGLGIECWSAGERSAFATAVEGPLYLAWYRELATRALRGLEPYKRRLRGTPGQVRDALLAKLRVLDRARREFRTVRPPDHVREDARGFGAALRGYRNLTARTARQLRGRRTISNAFAARYNRRARRLEDGLNARTRRLISALGRGIPAPPGPAPHRFVPS